MPKGEYKIFEALNPFFEVVMEGLRGLVSPHKGVLAHTFSIRGSLSAICAISGFGKTANPDGYFRNRFFVIVSAWLMSRLGMTSAERAAYLNRASRGSRDAISVCEVTER